MTALSPLTAGIPRMALRLTGPSLRRDAAAPSRRRCGAGRGGARGRATSPPTRRCSSSAAEHDDVHRRYRARTALLEQGSRQRAREHAARAHARSILQIARQAVELLEENPREPVLLNFAGVAFYELWSLDAAQALFEAALRLDPSLPHAARNLAQLASGAGARARAAAARAARGARPRSSAARASGRGRAQPAQRPDAQPLHDRARRGGDAAALPRGGRADAVDEIIDRRHRLARPHGRDRARRSARSVIEREWTGSFSDARNVSFDAATGDWLHVPRRRRGARRRGRRASCAR